MAQESYADFSIIQKYLDQKRYHDEEVINYKTRIGELEETIRTLHNELDAKDQALQQLRIQTEERKAQLQEKEKLLQELSIQTHRLKKQLEHSLSEKAPGEVENTNEMKKSTFGFMKK